MILTNYINQIILNKIMKTRNDLEYANSQPNENELEKERLVTISNRSVYHKYAEVTIPIPKRIKKEDVADWLFENENLYTDDLDQRLHESKYEFGFGLGEGMDEKDEESETRYDIEGEKYGGHL